MNEDGKFTLYDAEPVKSSTTVLLSDICTI